MLEKIVMDTTGIKNSCYFLKKWRNLWKMPNFWKFIKFILFVTNTAVACLTQQIAGKKRTKNHNSQGLE